MDIVIYVCNYTLADKVECGAASGASSFQLIKEQNHFLFLGQSELQAESLSPHVLQQKLKLQDQNDVLQQKQKLQDQNEKRRWTKNAYVAGCSI